MKYSLMIIFISVLFIACGDEYYGIKPDQKYEYAIETEPSLSLDRSYIYYVSTDTSYDQFSGIYRASVATPVREKILLGENFHSPTVGPNNDILAYLDSSRIKFYNISDSTNWSSDVTDSFESIVMIDTNLIMACRDDSLFLVENGSLQFYAMGWDPTIISLDTFLYVIGDDSLYHIIKGNKFNILPDTLFTYKTMARLRWPSIHPQSGRFVFDLNWFAQNMIYSRTTGLDSLTFIDSSEYSKGLLVNYDQVIFTGPDGRFYISPYNGAYSVPYIYVEN